MVTGVSILGGTDRIVAGEQDVLFVPRTVRPNSAPVLLFHGQMRTAIDWTDTASWPGSSKLANAFASLGLVTIAAYWSGPVWGNATFRSEVEAARTVATSLGANGQKIVVVGASMGALEALVIASHTPDEVACGVALIPAVDLDYFRDNDVPVGARSNINTAYGLIAGSTSASVPLPSDANPFADVNANKITSPFKFYGSSSDATANWSTTLAMVAKMKNATASDVSNAGHSDVTIAAAPLDEISKFVLANSQ